MELGKKRWQTVSAVLLTSMMASTVVALTAAPASAAPGGIVISELNYHAGSDLDTDDFVELTNTSTTPVDISGWSFSAGVTGVFAAGTVIPGNGYFVVAKDATQFQATYGFAPDAVYGGNLSNGGETVTLVNGASDTVDTVTYADTAPWPTAPDGTGPSLELRNLMSDNTQAINWGASLATGGTPGARNSIDGTVGTNGPSVDAMTATPARPVPNQAVVVSARLVPGSTAQLTYKVMFGPDVVLPFLDNAASPGGAGDGVYSASIPGQAAGKLIRYRVDALSGTTAYAAPVTGDSMRYHGVVVLNSAVTTQLPVIEWFMEDAVYEDILANHRMDKFKGAAVWAYNGEVIDGVQMSVRGNSSRTAPKVSWKIQMPKGYTFDLGGKLEYPLDSPAAPANGWRSPLACARFIYHSRGVDRQTEPCRTAGGPHATTHARRARRSTTHLSRRKAAAPGDRIRSFYFVDFLRSAGDRQNHSGERDRADDWIAVRIAQRGGIECGGDPCED